MRTQYDLEGHFSSIARIAPEEDDDDARAVVIPRNVTMLATTTRVTISARAATPRAQRRSAARPTQFGAVKGFDPLRCVR
jgi:hypothetical protein